MVVDHFVLLLRFWSHVYVSSASATGLYDRNCGLPVGIGDNVETMT